MVSELTLSCIPAMLLKEETFSETLSSIGQNHYERLRSYRHVRYMWIPFTSSVVVVTSNPYEESTSKDESAGSFKIEFCHAFHSYGFFSIYSPYFCPHDNTIFIFGVVITIILFINQNNITTNAFIASFFCALFVLITIFLAYILYYKTLLEFI